MSRGPGVHEIFSNQATGKTSAFRFEEQETKQQLKLSKKKDATPQSPMKKFGAYKPKILGEETDFLKFEGNPTTPTTNEVASSVSPRQGPSSSVGGPRVNSVPANPKPWVIGDKNVPMVLGSINDDDDDDDIVEQDGSFGINNSNHNDNNNNNEFNGYQRTFSISSDTSTLISQNSDNSRQGIDNPVMYANGTSSQSSLETKSTVSPKESDSNLNSQTFAHQQSTEPAEVFIPPPDYEEDEKTLDFNSEDTDDQGDGGDVRSPKDTRPKSIAKVYEGADFSQYLSEDDVEQVQLRNDPRPRNTLGRKSKSETQAQKLSDKHSMFKQSGKKSKRKSGGKTPTFSSVRSFSYADSKYGTTKGKSMSKSLSFSELTDDSEVFLSTNNHDSSYESFLRSRHGEALALETNFGRNEISESNRNSKLAHKNDTVWKKLTLRLKQSVNKSAKEH